MEPYPSFSLIRIMSLKELVEAAIMSQIRVSANFSTLVVARASFLLVFWSNPFLTQSQSFKMIFNCSMEISQLNKRASMRSVYSYLSVLCLVKCF